MIDYDEYEGVYFWIPDCRDKTFDGHLMKIGRSKDVLKRSQSLQTGCPYPLLQLWRLWVPGMSVSDLERDLHEQFKRYHIHHEWFAIPSISWEVTRDTMDLYYEFQSWDCLVRNGELGRWYVPDRLPESKIDGVINDATKAIRENAARRVGA